MDTSHKIIREIEIENSILDMLTTELNQGIIICDKLLEENNISQLKSEEKTKILSYFHKLKGSSGFIGFKKIESISRDLEALIRNDDDRYKDLIKELKLEINQLLSEIRISSKKS